MELFDGWQDAPTVPEDWKPLPPPGAVSKEPMTNRRLLRILREHLPGRWRKVYRKGIDGSELHYFEHDSGRVFNVKLVHPESR